MWDYPKYGCPIKKGAKYFYLHNSGLQNQRCNILEAMTFVAYENALKKHKNQALFLGIYAFHV